MHYTTAKSIVRGLPLYGHEGEEGAGYIWTRVIALNVHSPALQGALEIYLRVDKTKYFDKT